MPAFIARQPIFDRNLNVFTYQLLGSGSILDTVRGLGPARGSTDGEERELQSAALASLTGGKRAFITVQAEEAAFDKVKGLPKSSVVIVLQAGDAPVCEATLTHLQRLKENGYQFALSAPGSALESSPLLDLASLVTVDFALEPAAQRATLVNNLLRRHIAPVATNLATSNLYQEAVATGCEYFEGSFYTEPVISTGQRIPANKLYYIQLLHESRRKEMEFPRLEEIIKRDTSLSYKLVRYVNRAAIARKTEILSIRHALQFMGEKEIKRWVSLITLAGIAKDRPMELVTQSVARARFAETLALRAGMADHAEELFLMGMFSLLDVIMSLPFSAILADLPLSADVKNVLVGKPSRFRPIYDSMLAYERAGWEQAARGAQQMGLTGELLAESYLSSVAWADQQVAGDGVL